MKKPLKPFEAIRPENCQHTPDTRLENEREDVSIYTRPIKPIGDLILNHPSLSTWFIQGFASQERDGLWLHYTAVCTLLKYAQEKLEE